MIRPIGLLVSIVIGATMAQVPQPAGFGMFQYSGNSGAFTSHPGYLSYAYGNGVKNRYVATVPQGLSAQMTIDLTNSNYFRIRPYDFVVMYDGALASRIVTPCDVNSYVALGPSGVAYLSAVMANTSFVRSYTSGSNVVVADFCVNAYNSGPADFNMLGFQAFFSSVGKVPNPVTPPFQFTTRPTTPSPANNVCGRPVAVPSATPNLRIVNGATVPNGGMPWACAMVQSNGPFQFCDCTVINSQWVITAGHCVADSGEARIKAANKIYVGVTNLLNAGSQNIRQISRVILHPQYDSPSGSTNNDVALIKLETPITAWSSTLMPACLPTKPINAVAVQTGTKGRRICYVTGWGTLYEGQSNGGKIGSGTDQLLQDAIEMFSATDCQNNLSGFTFTDKMLCGGYDNGRFDSCQGDSGGPLVCDAGDGTWTLNGIVSWGIGCAKAGQPGVYTNVYALMPWITQTMATN